MKLNIKFQEFKKNHLKKKDQILFYSRKCKSYNNVENLGFILNGLLELHEVFGIFFIVKNINLSIIYTFVR